MQINICENPIATAKAFAEYMLAWHKQH